MPGIWNVNNGYNMNSKKISSKLTFEVGERFTGRVVSTGEGKDATIRLADGWQFIAEVDVDGKTNLNELKLVKFEVEGFENGKLKLKLINESSSKTSEVDENFQEIIDKEGLSKEDVAILKKMVKYNIPLTRENISEIKGLIQFGEKINMDSNEINSFIETYFSSRGIDINSEQGQAMKNILSNFLNEFKNMNMDEILTFIENNLEFSEENINSFNNLFKGDSSIEKILMNINQSLGDLDSSTDISESFKNFNTISENEQNKINNSSSENSNKAGLSKVYTENDPVSKKINVLDLLKTIASTGDDDDALMNKINGGNANSLDNSILEKLNDKEVSKMIKDIVGDGNKSDNIRNQASSLIESTNKSRVEDILSRALNKEVRLNENEYKQIVQIVNNNSTVASNKEGSFSSFRDLKSVNTFEPLTQGQLKDIIQTEMKNKINNVRDIVKNILNHSDAQNANFEKVMNLVKDNITDFKVFNSISDEYYYLNLDIPVQNSEYPCKLIIKDNRKDGKRIDRTNAKMVVSVKTANLGEVDGYLTMRENKIDVNLKCSDEYNLILNKHKNELVEGLSTLGLMVHVSISSKKEPVSLMSCRSFFSDINISAIDTKV